jgi:hypothetical protein
VIGIIYLFDQLTKTCRASAKGCANGCNVSFCMKQIPRVAKLEVIQEDLEALAGMHCLVALCAVGEEVIWKS